MRYLLAFLALLCVIGMFASSSSASVSADCAITYKVQDSPEVEPVGYDSVFALACSEEVDDYRTAIADETFVWMRPPDSVDQQPYLLTYTYLTSSTTLRHLEYNVKWRPTYNLLC